MSTFDFVHALQANGFSFAVRGSDLVVHPASQLNADERQYIRAHKLEIMEQAIRLSAGSSETSASISVEVWTPAGNSMIVLAESVQHAENLKRWNPPPSSAAQ